MNTAWLKQIMTTPFAFPSAQFPACLPAKVAMGLSYGRSDIRENKAGWEQI